MPTGITASGNITTYRAGSNAPLGALNRIRGATPNPVYTATGVASAVSWSDGGAGGTFSLSGANNGVASYTPRNKSQVITISASDAAGTITRALTVWATQPIHPQVGFEITLDQETKIKMARDRTRYFREEGSPEIDYVVGWDRRQNEQRAELMQFWNDHKKARQFYYVDTEGNIQNKVWFTSGLKQAFQGANKWAMSATVKGIFENTTAIGATPLYLQINCGGFDVPPFLSDRYYAGGATIFLGNVAINKNGIYNPPPDEVYRWVRYEQFAVQYYIPQLRSNYPYTVRLHFCIDNGRTLQPHLQGVAKANIVVPAGNVAALGEYPNILANNSGEISIIVYVIAGTNAILNALEIIEQ